MNPGGRLFPLQDFAHSFIRDKRTHNDIRTEDLAETFRRYFRLSQFPTIHELRDLCWRLNIEISPLPSGLDVSGLNAGGPTGGHEFYLRDDVSLAHYEHTLCHELREVLEQEFIVASSAYTGLDTANNDQMNPESNHFAACLLMQGDASRELLIGLGFDVVAFAYATGRSLSSVIMRAQELFPAKHAAGGVVAAIWLFEAPWAVRRLDQGVAVMHLEMAHRAHLCGFTIQKARRAGAHVIRHVFPQRGSTAADFDTTLRAFRTRRACLSRVEGFDIFGDRNFIVGAEPILTGPLPWRIVMTAVRTDFERNVQSWLARLGLDSGAPAYQRA